MKLLKIISVDHPETFLGMHEYRCADGTLILFDEKDKVPYNIRFMGYIDSICEHVDISEFVIENPKLLRKYDNELQDHVDSWGTPDDERIVDAAREA
jgi:hypothetical protein